MEAAYHAAPSLLITVLVFCWMLTRECAREPHTPGAPAATVPQPGVLLLSMAQGRGLDARSSLIMAWSGVVCCFTEWVSWYGLGCHLTATLVVMPLLHAFAGWMTWVISRIGPSKTKGHPVCLLSVLAVVNATLMIIFEWHNAMNPAVHTKDGVPEALSNDPEAGMYPFHARNDSVHASVPQMHFLTPLPEARNRLPLITEYGTMLVALFTASLFAAVSLRGLWSAFGMKHGAEGVPAGEEELRTSIETEHFVSWRELRLLIDTANAPIFGVDTNGDVNEWNNMTTQLTGYRRSEVVSLPLANFVTPSMRESVNTVLQRALKGDGTLNYGLALKTKQGGERQLLVNATTRWGFDGQVIGAVGVGQDITDMLRAQKLAEAQSRELLRLIETANSPIFGVDLHGNVNEWNESTVRITGYSKEEVLGKPLVKTYISELLQGAVDEVLRSALRGRETSNYELMFVAKTGQARQLLLNATTRRDVSGEIIGVVGVAQDITETLLAQGAAAVESRELRQLIQTANAPIFGVDKDGNVNEWNDMTALITGYGMDEAIGKPLVETFIHGPTQASVQAVLGRAINGEGTANYELVFMTKRGEERQLLVNATTRRDGEGRVTGVVAVAQDVTEMLRAQRELMSESRELRQLIQTANAPIFGVDINGNTNEWNDVTAAITGFTKQETIGRPLVQTYITGSLRDSVHAVLQRALQGQSTSNYELAFETKWGEVRKLLVNATTRRSADGHVTGVVGVAQDVTEMLRAQALAAAESRELRGLIDTANAPIFGVDMHGNTNEWNDMTANITGFTKAETIGKPLVQTYITESLRASVDAVLQRALKGEGTANYELSFETKSGEVRQLLVNATTRRSADGDIIGVVGVAQDVTDMLHAQVVAAAESRELRQLIDTANAPIFGVDVDGCTNEWNDATAQITGFTKQETLGRPLVETYITESLRSSVDAILRRALKGEGTSNYELAFETKSGEVRKLLVNATTRRDPTGCITGVVGVAQDVTEMLRAQAFAAAESRELRRLIDTANAPIFGVDVDGRTNEWNDTTAQITGFTKEETIGKPLVQRYITESLRSSVDAVLRRALKGEGTANYELAFQTKSGEVRQLLVNATTRRSAEGDIIGVVGVAQDVTDMLHAQVVAAAESRELRQLIDTANAPIFGVDLGGRTNEWNDMTAHITGFTKQETLGRPLVETYITESLRSSVDSVLRRALKGEGTSNYELSFETKSGDVRKLLVNATTRRSAHGQVSGVVGVAQDVTEMLRAQALAAAESRELRGLIDTANAPIFGVDVHGNTNEWNDMTAKITGFTKRETIGKPLVRTYITESLRASVEAVLRRALKGEGTANYELAFQTKSGEVRQLLVNATTRRSATGDIIGVVGVAQDVTDMLRAQGVAAAESRELRRLIDTANAPIFGVDVDGRTNEWNDMTESITGFTKFETMGKPLVHTYITESLRSAVDAVLKRALKGEGTSNYPLAFQTKSGVTRQLLVNATTRRNAEGEITGVVGVAQDITDMLRAQAVASEVSRELRGLIETANAPIFGVDVNGNINEWNDITAKITGYTKEETLGKPLVRTYITDSLRSSVEVVLQKALRGIGTSNYELAFETKNKEVRQLLLNATTRRSADGEIVGVVGVAQDVTEMLRAQAIADAERGELRLLIDTANAPIFGVDVRGRTNEWNDMTAKITGFTKQEAIGKPLVRTYITESLRGSVEAVLRSALKGVGTSNYELSFETKSGEVRQLLVNATTRRSADGDIIGVVGVAQDVTEILRAQNIAAAETRELRQLIDTANAPIFGVDVEGRCNEWNNMTAKITGFSKEETIGRPLVSTFITKSLQSSVNSVLQHALRGQGTSNYELQFETKSGEIRKLLMNATTRRSPSGKITGVMGVAQDVTDMQVIPVARTPSA